MLVNTLELNFSNNPGKNLMTSPEDANILLACKLPHQTGLPPDFPLQGSLQSRLGAIQQHPFSGPGYTRVDNLPGE